MKLAPRSIILFACAGGLAACDSGPRHVPTYRGQLDYQEVPVCDPTIQIAEDGPAVIITDPAALAGITFERVMERVGEDLGHVGPTLHLAQRLFEGSNDDSGAVFADSFHCDSPGNPAHMNGPAAFCPRTEGALAASDGLFTPGHKDHFFPVAVVNRFDLTPLTGEFCGEARIVLAKESGLTDPTDRVFIILEAAVPNLRFGDVYACRDVAEFWASLQDEKDPAAVGERLQTFFFTGTPSRPAVLNASDLGLGNGGGGYGGGGGQIRISQHMDEHWELRQLVASFSSAGEASFDPVLVGNNPLPRLFGDPETQDLDAIQQDFAYRFASGNVDSLAAPRVEHVRSTYVITDLSGESALGGDPVNDYVAHAANNTELRAAIEDRLSQISLDCPADDPMTADSILRRATMVSCAGCHAPSQLLGPDRKIGCGATWPDSLGQVHIDETGALSPALTGVFLPHRAQVLQDFLQACKPAGDVLDGTSGGSSTKRITRGQTLGGGMNTH